MLSRGSLFTVCCLVCCTASLLAGAQERQGRQGGRGRGAQAQEPAKPPATDKVTPEIPGVAKAGTKIEIVAFGLQGSDAGVGMPDGSFIATGNGGVIKIDTNGKMTTLVEDSEQAAGLAMDPKGRLIGAQYTKKVSVLYPKGSEETLTASFDGKPYIRPNDLVADKKGGVYFTDQLGIFADGIGPGVYYVKPDGHTIKISADISRPSGIMLSPDEKTLYVTDSVGTFIKTFDVQPDGNARNERNFAEAYERRPTHSLADGLAVDAAGRLYAATYLGVLVFSPKGEQLGRIRIPRQPVNLAFAGPDKKTLYVLGAILGLRDADSQPEFGSVYKIPMLAEGYKGRAK